MWLIFEPDCARRVHPMGPRASSSCSPVRGDPCGPAVALCSGRPPVKGRTSPSRAPSSHQARACTRSSWASASRQLATRLCPSSVARGLQVLELGEADLAALDAAFSPGAAVGDRYPENLERLIDKG